jgi:soluble lytic murein transglycosylase-like protein
MYLAATPNLDRYRDYIAAGAWLNDVPEEWIKAVILTESSGNPQAYRYEPKLQDASYGLMQLLYSTAKGLGYQGPAAGLYDPETNIKLGSRLLGQLKQRYGDSFPRVYSAYNSGRPDLYLSSTQVWNNVQRALNNLAQYAGEVKETVINVGGQIETSVQSNPIPVVVLGLALLAWRKRR